MCGCQYIAALPGSASSGIQSVCITFVITAVVYDSMCSCRYLLQPCPALRAVVYRTVCTAFFIMAVVYDSMYSCHYLLQP